MKLSTGVAACLLSTATASNSTGWPEYSEEELAAKRQQMAYIKDLFEQGNAANAYCNNDMRNNFPGCHQSGSMWCWATAVAAVEEYYNGGVGDQCRGKECEVVSYTYHKDCCPFRSKDDECGSKGGTTTMIKNAIHHFTGKNFVEAGGPLSEDQLAATLQAGNPVVLEVGTDSRPTHIVTIHGCDGNGQFWYHDPERNYGEWTLGDYGWLLNGMCRAWVDRSNARLVKCEGAKNPDEIFRVTSKWWDTVYIPAGADVTV